MKQCCRCREVKPEVEFYNDKSQPDGKTRRCKDCSKAVARAWRETDEGRAKEKWRAASRKYQRSKGLQTKYGITEEEYDKIREKQQGKCAICGVPEKDSAGRNPGRLCVDHDHKDGHVRGLLCGPCNTGLGIFKDSPELLRIATDYLS